MRRRFVDGGGRWVLGVGENRADGDQRLVTGDLLKDASVACCWDPRLAPRGEKPGDDLRLRL